MAIAVQSFKKNFVGLAPIILLYFLSISEIDTHFSNMFEILSFNLQLIIIYLNLKNIKKLILCIL